MWPNPQFPVDLVIFTEEILNGKLHYLCSANSKKVLLESALCNIYRLQIATLIQDDPTTGVFQGEQQHFKAFHNSYFWHYSVLRYIYWLYYNVISIYNIFYFSHHYKDLQKKGGCYLFSFQIPNFCRFSRFIFVDFSDCSRVTKIYFSHFTIRTFSLQDLT